ncbi:alpha-1,3-mannosyl-glycoprotein 4-beta-N-acetylglucosaminyltransferase A-like isoform X2 [Lepeophtheirus salmonis]|uniref:alpha-1,3-mannosyl-glycoprotein 4-beta-N-acetylglucosaminyltransferase A-like isoform X2 n=1 Tax=Lepeophtheirus salmonis TaxID=72036 RepID=UPI003AF3D063
MDLQDKIKEESSPSTKRFNHNSNFVPEGIRIVIGIPSSMRRSENYLFQTLKTLFKDKDILTNKYLIIVMLSTFNHTWRTSVKFNILSNFSNQINSGILQVILPEKDYYPNEMLRAFTSDMDKDYLIWMKKQSMDFAYLYRYTYQKFNFKYFLQLEDDSLPQVLIYQKWSLLFKSMKLWTIGCICIFADWEPLQNYSETMFKAFYNKIPCDWVLELFSIGKSFNCVTNKGSRYMTAARNTTCMSKLFPTINNSLFQHIGRESSLFGKVQNAIDNTFRD